MKTTSWRENWREAWRRIWRKTAHGVGAIYFLNGAAAGGVLLVLSFANPGAALGGIAALLAGQVFVRLAGFQADSALLPAYVYNPLLSGMAVGARFAPAWPTLLLAVAAGALAVALTALLANALATYLNLPVLSAPFALTAIVFCAAAPTYGAAPPAEYPVWSAMLYGVGAEAPLWIKAYFQAFGAMLFTPYFIVGAVLAFAVLCVSRILFFLSVLGFYSGALVRALLTGNVSEAFLHSGNFNFILIAMAVGGVFLAPSIKSYGLAILATLLGALALDAAERFFAPSAELVYTLPFVASTLLALYTLRMGSSPLLPKIIGKTPEETLERHIADKVRFTGPDITIGLPFSGAWTVWQGTDGEWTHKGAWKHAFDFVITGEDGLTHRGEGRRLEDYHAYRKPVLAPISGRVTAVVDGLPDNPIGRCDKENNWGNHIILQSDKGVFVEISHFAAGSIKVHANQRVKRGAMLGLCGNSGYSPEPHIHIQVQKTGEIGAQTRPFGFLGFMENQAYSTSAVPKKGAILSPLYPAPRLERAVSPVLEREFVFEVQQQGREPEQHALTVEMAPGGGAALKSERGALHFGRRGDTHFLYSVEGDDPLLSALFAALPSLPLGFRQGVVWEDRLPASLAVGLNSRLTPRVLGKYLAGFLAAFAPSWGVVSARCAYTAPDTVRTELVSRRLGLCESITAQLGDAPVPVRVETPFLRIRLLNQGRAFRPAPVEEFQFPAPAAQSPLTGGADNSGEAPLVDILQ